MSSVKKPDKCGVVADRPELRKTNELIARPIVSGHFTLLGRKVFNAMILYAQQARVPGGNAPEDREAYKKLFWVPLANIAKDASYDSNDTALLKEVAGQLMDIRVESETETEWTADHLVEQVKIVNPNGLNRRGGRVWVGYRFPDEVLHLVTDPRRYTKLPIFYLTQLRSNAAVALYEVAKESAWKTSGLTTRAPWEDWQAIFDGRPKDEIAGWKSEYKFFKDRVLKRAIQEINTQTDVTVELLEFKNGRKVGSIQFRVRTKEQIQLEFPPPPLIDTSTIDAIRAFGLAKREAEDILAANEVGFLKATCEYVRKRASDPKLPPLGSQAAFFRSALRGRYVESANPKPLPTPKAAATESGVDPEASQARDDAAKRLDAMEDEQRHALIEEFYQANPALRVIAKNKSSNMVRKMIANWMAANGR